MAILGKFIKSGNHFLLILVKTLFATPNDDERENFMSLSATKIRPGNVVEHENGLWMCLTFNMITPGRRKAIVEVKMRNVKDRI